MSCLLGNLLKNLFLGSNCHLHRVANCSNGEVRLVNSKVESCLNGRWGGVCSVGWTEAMAGLLCYKLGFFNGESSLRSLFPCAACLLHATLQWL